MSFLNLKPERNQCDGCMSGHKVNIHKNHVNEKGRSYMVCQARRYGHPVPEPETRPVPYRDEETVAMFSTIYENRHKFTVERVLALLRKAKDADES